MVLDFSASPKTTRHESTKFASFMTQKPHILTQLSEIFRLVRNFIEFAQKNNV
jgi:hypothetical protein